MKKFFLITVVTAMLLLFAACNSNPTNSSNPTNTPDNAVSYVYGTATLTYAEFYSGDVSSTESFDAVSSATNSKHSTFSNVATDFVDAETNANGYHITGVKNVNIAVPADDYDKYVSINPTFTRIEGNAPAQYKTVKIESNKAVYSATKFNIADTVTDATATLLTGTNWGDYQINVTDGKTVHLRNSRDNNFDINADIQGIILETENGLKVGMEALQSIWVQTYEVSFNVIEDNSHNKHIVGYDNLAELSKLVGQNVTQITYIMPDKTYVYKFDGIYVKPIFKQNITSVLLDSEITLSTSDFSAFTNGKLKVIYKIGSGRAAKSYTLLETDLKDGIQSYNVDLSVIADVENNGSYSALILSDTYADITVDIPMSAVQKAELVNLVSNAKSMLIEKPSNKAALEDHIEEAEELLANENSSSSKAASLIAELTELISAQ